MTLLWVSFLVVGFPPSFCGSPSFLLRIYLLRCISTLSKGVASRFRKILWNFLFSDLASSLALLRISVLICSVFTVILSGLGFSLSVDSLSVFVCSRVTATTSTSSSFNSRHSCRTFSWSCCFLLSGSFDLLSGTLKAMMLVLRMSLCVISLEVSSLLRSSSDSTIESCFLNSWTSLEFEFGSPSVSFGLADLLAGFFYRGYVTFQSLEISNIFCQLVDSGVYRFYISFPLTLHFLDFFHCLSHVVLTYIFNKLVCLGCLYSRTPACDAEPVHIVIFQ